MSRDNSPGSPNLLSAIDARTNLAGTNKMELLLFKVGSPEIYGINVFKIKEVIRQVEITHAPQQPEFVVGMASIRNELIPVVDLIAVCGNPPLSTPPIMIITEFSHSTQAFLVESVDTIIRVDWSDVHQPPAMLSNHSKLIGVTRLADGQLAAILDVEQILHVIRGAPGFSESFYAQLGVSAEQISPDIKCFCVDDSAFARSQLQQVLDGLGVKSEFAINGRDAWARLEGMAKLAEATGRRMVDAFPIIITDIEMPELDGFKLTQMIKADQRFAGVKILLHSSMSESSNRDKGLALGADGFLPKYNPAEVAEGLRGFLLQVGKAQAS